MTLRILQIFSSESDRDTVVQLVEEAEPVEHWSHDLDGDRILTEVILSADEAEELTDTLQEKLSEGFRLVLLPVKATIPRVEDEEEEEQEEEQEEEEGAPPGRLSREELYADMRKGAAIDRVYVVTIIMASVLAAVGLVRDDPAILVGAMVVAPLLGPNLALAFGATLGDISLIGRSLKSTGLGLVLGLGFSVLVGFLMGVDPTMEAIAYRTRAGIPDVAVALAAGSAGALTFTTGIPSALVGVMVAVALLPPLVNAGLLLGSGYVSASLGAMVLVLTNVVGLNLAAVATFQLQRIRPRTWWEEEKASKATRISYGVGALLLAGLVATMLWAW